MSFSIVSSGSGLVKLVIEGSLDDATLSVLRRELATLIRTRPSRAELRVVHPDLVSTSARVLLLSFFDLLRAQGGRLTLCGPGMSSAAIVDLPQMDRLLKSPSLIAIA